MFGAGGGFGGAGAAAGNPNPNGDVMLDQSPTDCVSALQWCPTANNGVFLAASSWDGKVRVWQIDPNSGNAAPKLALGPPPLTQNLQNPILDCTWEHTGTKMYIGCGDNKGYACDLGSQQVVQVAQHDAPIKVARWVQVGQTPVLATGSWDKTVKYWDTRSPNPIATVPMKGKVYCADFLGNLGVVCTSDRSIYIFDMNNPSKEFKSFQSPLKYQTRTVACSPDKTNFALGSIEGRIAIHYIADNQRGSDFAFKCHRDGTNDKSLVFAINCISWHMQQGTFASGGSDGNYNFWDKDARTRCKSFERMPQPITAVSFSPDGNMFAYAQGYDWSKGAEGFNQNLKPLVHVHGVKLEEVKKKPPNSGGSRR